ncbi:hypothetical protein MRY87_11100 [bacterium]|nr:hypothetical protein [bacterium]
MPTPLSLLVVDDSLEDFEIFEYSLKRAKISEDLDLAHATTCEQGLAYVRQALQKQAPYHAIFLDLKLPDAFGAEIPSRFYREVEKRSRIYILSGFDAPEALAGPERELIDDYLIKGESDIAPIIHELRKSIPA